MFRVETELPCLQGHFNGEIIWNLMRKLARGKFLPKHYGLAVCKLSVSSFCSFCHLTHSPSHLVLTPSLTAVLSFFSSFHPWQAWPPPRLPSTWGNRRVVSPAPTSWCLQKHKQVTICVALLVKAHSTSYCATTAPQMLKLTTHTISRSYSSVGYPHHVVRSTPSALMRLWALCGHQENYPFLKCLILFLFFF